MGTRRHVVISAAAVAAFIAFWQLASTAWIDPFFLPAPSTVLRGAIELLRRGTLLPALGASLGRVFAGWLIGSTAAIPVGLFIGSSRIAKSAVDPFIHFFRFIPAIALITLFMVWFGVGELSRILLIIYSTGFIVMINTATGVAAVERDKIDAARSLGATGLRTFCHVTFPATIPYIYVGMRLAMASSFLVIIAAEMLAAQSGLGSLIWTSRLYFRIDWMFVGIVLLGLLGFGSDRLWRLLGNGLLGKYVREVGRY
jgi:ABC-type nitrate/sulfonate/bicarbonate transport system permease component